MNTWNIKYRSEFSETGVAYMEVFAATAEEAEAVWKEVLEADGEFGAIIRTTPEDPLAHP